MTVDRTSQLLSSIETFSNLDSHELDCVAKYITELNFSTGATIMRQGQQQDGGFYIIKNGRVGVSVRLPGDVKSKITELSNNEFFGEVTLLEGGVPTAYITALEDTSCYFLDKNYFDALKISYPIIAYKITYSIAKLVCSRLRNISTSVGGKLDDVQSRTNAKTTASAKPISLETKDIDFLAQLDIFSNLTHHEVVKLLKCMHLYSYPKYSYVFYEGDVPDNCYIIVQGAIQVILEQDDKISKIAVLGPGNIFGHMSLIDHGPRSATCQVREDATLLQASLDEILYLKDHDEFLYHKFFYAICHDLVSTLRKADKLLIRLNVESRD